MIYFNCDYMAGAHPEVLKALCDTNLLKTVGYGFDEFTSEARSAILKACGLQEGAVFFLQGGTQTNKTVIDRLLSKNDGVLCCDSGHINVHEAGAIEADGHKVLPLPSKDGKLEAKTVKTYVEEFYRDETNEHMVRPAMVYISHPTEFGTLYTLRELEEMAEACRSFEMPLFIDGARLAYGLASESTDVTLQDIARLSDVFYIGGTKCGALFGEAVVTRRPELFPRFMSLMKLHGALLAKGRILAIQFLTLFSPDLQPTDDLHSNENLHAATGHDSKDKDYLHASTGHDSKDIDNLNVSAGINVNDILYLRIGKHADALAKSLKDGLCAKGYKQYIDSPTNQQFFILPNEVIDRLSTSVGFELWGPRGEKESIVRFVTDWSTTPSDITTLLSLL